MEDILELGCPVGLGERLFARALARAEPARDNREGRLISLMRDTGSSDVKEIEGRGTFFGSTWHHRATKTSNAPPLARSQSR